MSSDEIQSLGYDSIVYRQYNRGALCLLNVKFPVSREWDERNASPW